MKIGSIIQCINSTTFEKELFPELTFPNLYTIYTIRDLEVCLCGDCSGVFVRLEEIINPITEWDNGDKAEIMFDIQYFAEIGFNENKIKELIDNKIL